MEDEPSMPREGKASKTMFVCVRRLRFLRLPLAQVTRLAARRLQNSDRRFSSSVASRLHRPATELCNECISPYAIIGCLTLQAIDFRNA